MIAIHEKEATKTLWALNVLNSGALPSIFAQKAYLNIWHKWDADTYAEMKTRLNVG